MRRSRVTSRNNVDGRPAIAPWDISSASGSVSFIARHQPPKFAVAEPVADGQSVPVGEPVTESDAGTGQPDAGPGHGAGHQSDRAGDVARFLSPGPGAKLTWPQFVLSAGIDMSGGE